MKYKNITVYISNLLPEVFVFEPSLYYDERGNIYTSFVQDVYSNYLPENIKFIHDKFAESRFNVLRGLHGDTKTWKLVSCVWGELYEVVADMRQNSPNYKKWDAFELSSARYRQILIPPGFVNGYYVKSEYAIFHYKLAYEGEYVDAGEQITIKWDDPELKIKWPCKVPILQKRDR